MYNQPTLIPFVPSSLHVIPLSRLPSVLDLIGQIALDLVRVERPEHLAKLGVVRSPVAEPRVEASHQLQRLRHLLLHSKDDLQTDLLAKLGHGGLARLRH